MRTQIQESKMALRRELRERLSKLSEPQRVAASARAQTLLADQKIWSAAKSILFYAPLPDELDLWPLVGTCLAAGKTAALPRYDASEKKYVAACVVDPIRDLKPG